MKSGATVRGVGDEWFVDTYPAIHCCVANIFNQTVKLAHIAGVVEKTLDPPLFHQWFEFSEDVFHVPNNPSVRPDS